MSRLDNIPISIEVSGNVPGTWGNALPLLHEIRHGLQRLSESGESSLIDLHAVPFGPGDEDRLLRFLGRGEAQAEINALGLTRISESVFAGVWLVDHRNANDERIAFQIEITSIPEILRSQPQDVHVALEALNARLSGLENIDEF